VGVGETSRSATASLSDPQPVPDGQIFYDSQSSPTDLVEVINSGDCAHLIVHVRLVGDADTSYARQRQYTVNPDCTVTFGTIERILLRSPLAAAAAPTTYYYNYHHSSQTLQDAINIDVAKTRLVDKKFWNNYSTWLDDPWCYATCHLYGVVKAYTGKTWNHPTGVDFPYIGESCRHDTNCSDNLIIGHGHFHTDFGWCNLGSGAHQEIDQWNDNYSRANGTYWTDFYHQAPCAGLHNATKVWADTNPSVDEN
jgi:hypothetical protein